MLLSESDVPLYDPLTLHAQLAAEERSRVNLCRDTAPTDTRRWSWRMAVRGRGGHGRSAGLQRGWRGAARQGRVGCSACLPTDPTDRLN